MKSCIFVRYQTYIGMKANQKKLDEKCIFFIFFPYKNVWKKLFLSVSASNLKTTKSLLLVNYMSPESVASNQAYPSSPKTQSALLQICYNANKKKIKNEIFASWYNVQNIQKLVTFI